MRVTAFKGSCNLLFLLIVFGSSRGDEHTYRLLEEVISEVQRLQQQMNRFENLFTKDECADGTHSCDPKANCIEALVNYKCQCPAGYTGDGLTCHDIDECTGNPCIEQYTKSTTCVNTDGSYECRCGEGFRKNGSTCEDIDECAGVLHDCDSAAICTNTVGGYSCSCPPDFIGDGYTCTERTCKKPFTRFPNMGCLYLVSEPLNWHDARAACRNLGADLYTAQTKKHFQILRDHFYAKKITVYGADGLPDLDRARGIEPAHPWVGVHERQWINNNRRTVDSDEWDSRQSSDVENMCGYMRWRSRGLLVNYSCDIETDYLCQEV